MDTMKKNIRTRFRAYQLGSAGSSFSYSAGDHFILIEARLTDVNRPTILDEMRICGVDSIDTLHITGWGADHCSSSEIDELLRLLKPARIECPGYLPHRQSGKTCKRLIEAYQSRSNSPVDVKDINPDYIKGLNIAGELGYRDVLYHPKFIGPESENLSASLRRDKYLRREMDMLILAYHGADNGFTNKKFLRCVKPRVVICSSNYDNQFNHPKPEIRQLLFDERIKLGVYPFEASMP